LSVVIDANVVVVLALDRRRAPAVDDRLRRWAEVGEDLHAPALLPFEVASALATAVATDRLRSEDVARAWADISAVPMTLHALDDGPSVVATAQRLERRSAYDAAYVVLAQQIESKLWTLDRRLARNAGDRGLPVRLIETP
jgi:predicted nucleic acid-binding protein